MQDQEDISLSRRTLLAGAVVLGVTGTMLGSGKAMADTAVSPKNMSPAPDLSKLERVKIELLTPPFVHPHEARATGKPKVVEFTMVIEEKTLTLDDDGTQVHAMTFNGSVPGPLMVVHQDDYVELTLVNPATNTMAHNIDFHASTGALGGGGLTHVSPGEQVKLRFKATRAGVFVYHCAPGGAMIPWHVVSGMNGAIMVLPRDGLKDRNGKSLKYDKVFYVGEQDFYVPRDKDGKFKRYNSPMEGFNDMQEVMKGLIPSHIVFNGKVGALTGKNALKANVGETVLIVHSQANRDTRPHLIGGHGDYVWATGKFNNPPEEDLETWFIPGGAAGAALYTFLQPGLYAYLNHNLIEGVLLGASAHFQVEGQWNNDLMAQIEPPKPIK
ncbi:MULTISPECIES: copper-containing nitrite reductase [Pseudomonas aeruginosa group]|uniref:copper-containing nitrite reductase n=2 Tax=Pseudomonas TaxID=286 RepID=UPI0035A239B0|nr:nitrite reductase (NO-forming) [Pseudomonas nitroreducens]MCP1686861.1 nitrite reductase (NO-forming) [Pseudomonas nitroreducens]